MKLLYIRSLSFIIICFVWLIGAYTVHAVAPSISGQVKTQTGAPIIGATIVQETRPYTHDTCLGYWRNDDEQGTVCEGGLGEPVTAPNRRTAQSTNQGYFLNGSDGFGCQENPHTLKAELPNGMQGTCSARLVPSSQGSCKYFNNNPGNIIELINDGKNCRLDFVCNVTPPIPVAGKVIDSTNQSGIPGALIEIFNDRGDSVTVQTDANGQFSKSGFIGRHETYAVRVRAVPGEYIYDTRKAIGFEGDMSNTWIPSQSRDTPYGSQSYELQVLEDNDCSSVNHHGSGRCNFQIDPVPQQNPPKGYIVYPGGASQTCKIITGWSCDLDKGDHSMQVDLYDYTNYIPGVNQPQLLGSVVANKSHYNGQALKDQCGGFENHGYEFSVPNSLKDNRPHKVAAIGVNIDASGTKQPSGNRALTSIPANGQNYVTVSCVTTATPPCTHGSTNADGVTSCSSSYSPTIAPNTCSTINQTRPCWRNSLANGSNACIITAFTETKTTTSVCSGGLVCDNGTCITRLNADACTASPNPAKPSGTITWTATASGGNNSGKQYRWNGQTSYSLTQQITTTTAPNTAGTVTNQFWVTDGNQTAGPTSCSVTVDYAAWLKTTSGDVHSNQGINTPGGP
jgi:hypothetical protein